MIEQGFDATGFERNEYVGGLWQFNPDPKQTTALKGRSFGDLARCVVLIDCSDEDECNQAVCEPSSRIKEVPTVDSALYSQLSRLTRTLSSLQVRVPDPVYRAIY